MGAVAVDLVRCGGLDIRVSDRVAAYVEQAAAQNTRRAYRSALERFRVWCEERGEVCLPAAPETVAAYLADLADSGRRASTIALTAAAIAKAHVTAGYMSPSASPVVRAALSGIRRTIGVARQRKTPVLTDDLRAMLNALPANLRGLRDRALLLVGFAGGFRRSELAALRREDLEFTADGVRVYLRRSKTDQDGAGRYVGIRFGQNPDTCPVRTLWEWLRRAGIDSGPVFRAVDRHGHVSDGMTPQTVAIAVKRAAEAAGLDASRYSGHSLRAGCVTQGYLNGAPVEAIMRQTGHRNTDTVNGYIRIADLFRDNVSARLGL